MGPVKDVRGRVLQGFHSEVSESRPRNPQELTMADLAFVVTTVALFALVAFVAKGVAKL
ncbi:hypothetical protein ABIC27_000004 [Streptomyces sp. PvR034]